METKLHADSLTFGRALNNALLFTGDKTRPILGQVQMLVTGNRLTFVATDSYALYRETIDCDSSDDARLDVTSDMLATIAKASVANKHGRTGIIVDGNDVTVNIGAQTFSTSHGQVGQFPNWEILIPSDDALGGGQFTEIGLGGWQLARLGKIKTDSRQPTVRFLFQDALKPCVARIGEDIEVLLMPVRL